MLPGRNLIEGLTRVCTRCFSDCALSAYRPISSRLHYLENRIRELESRSATSQSFSDAVPSEDELIDTPRSPPTLFTGGAHLTNTATDTRTGRHTLYHGQDDSTTISSNAPASGPVIEPANETVNEPANTSTDQPAIFHGQNDSTPISSNARPPPVYEVGAVPNHQHVIHTASPMTQSSAVSAPTSITRDQPLAHEVGLLSLANYSDPKYLGPSSGVPFARLIYESAPQSQGLSLKDWSQASGLGDSEKGGPRNVQPADLPLPAECHQYAEAYFEVAVFLPFMMHDEVFDLLDDVQRFQETGVWKPALPIVLGFGQAFLLLSLGARSLETKLKSDFNSSGLLAAGMRYATQVQLHDSTEGIQVLLLMVLNSFYNPEGLNAWYLLHTIIASCLDLGLQRSNNSSSKPFSNIIHTILLIYNTLQINGTSKQQSNAANGTNGAQYFGLHIR